MVGKGFAHSDQLGKATPDKPEAEHREAGVLSLRMLLLGRRQLDHENRPFQFALDIAMAHYGWRIEPYRLEQFPGAYITNIFVVTEAPTHVTSFESARLRTPSRRAYPQLHWSGLHFQALDESIKTHNSHLATYCSGRAWHWENCSP